MAGPPRTESRPSGATEKLQKVLARAGLGSRRELEGWIAEGRVTVNGVPATLGDRVGADDRVAVDGRPLAAGSSAPRCRVLLYNKPEDEICTRRDPGGRPTVYDRLPPLRRGRWVSVGRLDINTAGLLLFTTDGELANRLAHPAARIEREYAVRVMGRVTPAMIDRLREGVAMDGHWSRFSDVRRHGGEGVNQWYHVVIVGGRNREVRRLWESQGLKVSRLKRVRFGELLIPSAVRRGRYREMTPAEIARLRDFVAAAEARAGRPPRKAPEVSRRD